MDTFICGQCDGVFHDISKFISHKSECCSSKIDLAQSNLATVVHIIQEEDVKPVTTTDTSLTADTGAQYVSMAHVLPSVGQQQLPVIENVIDGADSDLSGTAVQPEEPSTSEPPSTSEAMLGGFMAQVKDVMQESSQLDFGQIEVVEAIDGESNSKVAFEQPQEQGMTFIVENDTLVQVLQSASDDLGTLVEGHGEVMVLSQEQLQLLGENHYTIEEQPSGENITEERKHLGLEYPENLQVKQEETRCNQIELVPVNKSGTVDLAIVVKTPEEIDSERNFQQQKQSDPLKQQQGSGEVKPVRKRGRPRKGEEKPKVVVSKEEEEIIDDVTIKEENEKPPLPDKAEDGRFHCSRCKKAFNRERHYNTHRCLTWSDYYNISGPKDPTNSEHTSDVEEDQSSDPTVNFNKKPGKRRKYAAREDTRPVLPVEENQTEKQSTEAAQLQVSQLKFVPQSTVDNSMEPDMSDRSRKGKGKTKKIFITDGEETADKRSVSEKPVFTSESDKVSFDDAINVDLSLVDHLITSHHIEQELNENAVIGAGRMTSQISVFTCNECKRVFMSMSQCRMHCLTHTDLKPFKCIKCDFTSKSKGNLYTHMRTHTGQFYYCAHCDFKTGNKGHLVEHEETHTGSKHTCQLCQKLYSTKKSLVNHIRAYHSSCEQGKAYLQEFMVRGPRGQNSVLHQCHICNRKFKKKVDRDRHLYFHNIKNLPYNFRCDLCGYTTNRRDYLDKHYHKHKIVYVCVLCDHKVTSTIRLNDHLTEAHTEVVGSQIHWTEKYDTWKDLFEQCICTSLIMPDTLNEGIVQINSVTNEEGETFEQLIIQTGASGFSDMSDNREPVGLDRKLEGLDGQRASDMLLDALKVDSADALEDNQELLPVDSLSEQGPPSKEEETVYKRLGYMQMTMDDFNALRAVYGNEECEFCGRLFYSKHDYEPHLRTHTGDKPFFCKKCSYRCNTNDNLVRHVQKEHEQVVFKCASCEFIGSGRTQLWVHQKQMHSSVPAVCTECGDKFENFRVLKAHLQIKHTELSAEQKKRMLFPSSKNHLQIGRRVYKCPHCEKTFLRDYYSFRKHLWMHQGLKPYKCTLCDYACRSKTNLDSHMIRHSDEKPFQCTVCSKAYKSRTALHWHQRSHKYGREFKCSKCNYKALQEGHLKRHLQIHNLIKRYQCQYCDYSANTSGCMKIHYSKKHNGYFYIPVVNTPHLKDSNAKVFKCVDCQFLFASLSEMKRHLKVKHNLDDADLKGIPNLNEPTTIVVFNSENNVHTVQNHMVEEHPHMVNNDMENITSAASIETASSDLMTEFIITADDVDTSKKADVCFTLKPGPADAISAATSTTFDPGSTEMPPSSSDYIVMDTSQFVVNSNSAVDNGNTNALPSGDYVVQYVSEEVINSINSEGNPTVKAMVDVGSKPEETATSLSDTLMTDVISTV